ncbi:MAG: sigma-54-dependent Fis family transcriptional regulator [Acidobacteria bacterium]|nr:sigma-54-dependent Fis family transcriptional regulator [Acidobacteriota bacterium]
MSIAKILVVDDDPSLRRLMQVTLMEHDYEVFIAGTGEEGLKILAEQNIDVALTDLNLPDFDGIDLVQEIRKRSSSTQIIVITGYGSVAKAAAATKAGAFYFLEKPVDFDELQILLDKALEHQQQNVELTKLRRRFDLRPSYFGIIGRSKAMERVYEVIEGIAESEANVLIIGESGTGKELVASAIHERSHRAKKPIMQVNCAALPKELIESELFGHTKGAFTGAHADKLGLIGRAAGGSLFLDEIGEMPLELQPKLLRVLQERVYYRVGSEKPLTADFRLIAATNRNPFDAIRDGHLREDLYYRLNTIEIHVPPLRERPEDIHLLADHFRQQYAERYKRNITAISEQAYAQLFNYHWPGNVRELQNALERAVLMCRGEIIEAHHFPTRQPAGASVLAANSFPAIEPVAPPVPEVPVSHSVVPTIPVSVPSAPPNTPEVYTIEELCNLIIDKVPTPKQGAPMNELFGQLEVYLARAAVKRTGGNKQAAASLLGIYRPRLYSLLRKDEATPEKANVEEDAPPTASASV